MIREGDSKGPVTNYRERAGACEVFPLRKGGGAEKVLAMLKGGTTSFRVVFMW